MTMTFRPGCSRCFAERSKLTPQLLIAVAAAAIVATSAAACSADQSKTNSTTAAPANTAAPITGSTATATAGAKFVGAWHVHGAGLTITPTTATIVANAGPCGSPPGSRGLCSEKDTFSVGSSSDTQLTLSVTGVTFTDQTGSSVANPNQGPATAVGDTMQLTLQAPGLLKVTSLQGFPGLAKGNPYWCGTGINQDNGRLCGA